MRMVRLLGVNIRVIFQHHKLGHADKDSPHERSQNAKWAMLFRYLRDFLKNKNGT